MGIFIFEYEKIELLVCVYEISRELVFIYGIYGCSRCLRGEYFSEKPIFLHEPQNWPCMRIQEPLAPGQ